MAALSANTTVIYDPGAPPLGGDQGKIWPVGAITDEFYRGALITAAVGTGTAVCTSADASEFVGVCAERKSFTGTAGVLRVYINGVFWFATTYAANANYANTGYAAATAASDNPADIIQLAAGTTGQVGTLVHVDVTATSGWFDISIGARGARGTNS
jgi:putative intracellular protease/amidase